eukprot:CAMPEP_0178374274 /NCGR_PEP_ID=MMETSP0689_2-20121128/2292_1 /TAXON_ID=160604 /ORGANISM="Amphidinium massartii, Strain CS-259" /LENGTH=835 /DNA_ID=CAMNT_0019994239 /DNA_START=214 /DNA_END=2718 /DNA_ORIENTATION=+
MSLQGTPRLGPQPSNADNVDAAECSIGLLRFRTAVLQVLHGLRAHQDPSNYEALVFRGSLRSLHCSHEGYVNGFPQATERPESVPNDPAESPQSPLSPISPKLEHPAGQQSPTAEQLREMVSKLHYAYLPPLEEATSVVVAARKHLQQLPNVVHVDVPAGGRMVVVGDLHGQLADMEQTLRAYGGPSERTSFLFNGDFVDRGRYGIEVLLTLFCYMLLYPATVHLNRGNHECDRLNRVYGFHAEVTAKYKEGSERLYRLIQEAFLQLPLVYIVGEKIAVLHGGLPWDMEVTLDEIQEMDRSNPPGLLRAMGQPLTREERIYEALLWSDPKDFVDGRDWQPSDRGAGILFGEGLTRAFLKRNALKHLIRSHQVHSPGYAVNHTGLTTTVFTASNYAGTDNNLGCYLVLSPSLDLEFCQHSVLGPGVNRSITPSRSLQVLLEDGPLPLAVPVMTGTMEWPLKAKRECLGHLWCSIFAKRPELLHAFEMLDPLRCGTVSLCEWVQVCSECIHRDLPWYTLSRFLVLRDEQHRVPYLLFLERFQNRLVRRLMRVWATKMLPFLSQRLQENLIQTRGSRASSHLQVSYQKLCKLLRQELPGIKERSAYYLMVTLLQNEGGDITSLQDAEKPPSAVDLWALWAFRPHEWDRLHRTWKHHHPVVRGQFVADAMTATGQVGQAARKRWQATASCFDLDGRGTIEWRQVQAAAENLGKEWLLAQLVLDIVTATASACVRLKDLFASMDVQGLGKLPTNYLVRATEPWLGRRLTCQEAMILSYAFDPTADGTVAAADFAKTLEVVDTWDLSPPEVCEGSLVQVGSLKASSPDDSAGGVFHNFLEE